MSPVRSVKNQYLGINAHLHSYWQSMGGWEEFHTSSIVNISNALRIQLLPMGYTTGLEHSLQIRREENDDVERPKSDVTIYDTDVIRTTQPTVRHGTDTAELLMPLNKALQRSVISEKPYRAIGIYAAGRQDRGKPVGWIELLSPSNKPGGQDDEYYLNKRQSILEQGIVFVEVDYLHETPPTLESLPSYWRRGRLIAQDAHPYRILVLDPRPEIDDGQAHVYQFDVDEVVPIVKIPLSATDIIEFDFGHPYRKTYEEGVFGLLFVDYAELPMRFERYSPADQTRIARRMLAVLEAARNGVDLETAPFAVKEITLEDALSKLELLKATP